MRRSVFTLILAGGSALALAAFLSDRTPPVAEPALITIPAAPFAYRPAGDFRIGTRVVDAPLSIETLPAFAIMAAPVTEAAYVACVADRVCAPSSGNGSATLAQVDVSFVDARTYAAWLSQETGHRWRLPTDAEWQRAAAERVLEARPADDANGDDPAQRWLADYRREVEIRGDADRVRWPIGGFGTNTLGLVDMAGNIWEWTETCFVNGQVSADGSTVALASDYCGVRLAAGKHRAFVIDFVRDATTGGCGAGVPPDYLGFRLVRE